MRLSMPSVSFSKATAASVQARICRWSMPQGGANKRPGRSHGREPESWPTASVTVLCRFSASCELLNNSTNSAMQMSFIAQE